MSEYSEWQRSWRRFRRNRPAVAGLTFLCLSVLLAFLGYGIVPDDSANANTQIPELALQPPGARVKLLALPLQGEPEAAGIGQVLCSGRPVSERYIPVMDSLRVDGDSLYFRRLGGKPDWERLHLAELWRPASDSLVSDGSVYRLGKSGEQVSRPELADRCRRGEVLRERVFPLGADKYGRCILSRLILGFRVSLSVGLIAVLISLSIGVLVGITSGYYGGRLDDWMMLLINTIWSIPTLLLVFAIVLALGRGVGAIFLAVGLSMWVDVARMVRGQTLAIRSLPFVEAAQAMGLGHGRILFRHVLPNLLGPVMVVAAGNFATAVLLESGLSYLGFGVQPPAPSWGSMLNEHYGYAISGNFLPAIAPATAIALTVLAFNLVGNGLRDALDVKAN